MARDRARFNAYHRVYQLRKYHQRRKQALALLGNECKKCGGKENLEIDHIDRASKAFPISKLWAVPEARFLEELNKCQLLCQPCHSFKTVDDMGKTHRKTRLEIKMKSPKMPKKLPS